VFWAALWGLVKLAAMTYAVQLLTPRPKPEPARAGALSDFQLPTAEEGTPIPVLRGTGLLKAPIIGWKGDFYAEPFADHDVVIGHHYHLGLDLIYCHGPIDEIHEIRFGEKVLAPPGNAIGEDCVLRVEDGGGAHDVTLPRGTYARLGLLASAASSAIGSEVPGFGRIVYGYEIPADTTLEFAVTRGGTTYDYSAELVAGSYREGTDLAAALTRAMIDAMGLGARLSAKWTFPLGSRRFTLALEVKAGWDVSRFTIDPDSTVLPFLGIDHGGSDVFETVSFPATHVAEHPTYARRYFFDLAAGVTIHWPDSAAARELFGMAAAAPDWTASSACDQDRRASGTGVTFTDHGEYITLAVNAPELFGGIRGGGAGGVWGEMRLYKGTETQPVSDYLAQFQSPLSAYPGIAHMVCHWFVWGTQTVLAAPALVVTSLPNPLELADGKHRLGLDYNPGALLWELCTDEIWGPAIAPELLDRPQFVALANQCYDEGRGGTWIFDRQSPAADLLAAVCRQVNAMPVIDPATGLFSFRLVRAVDPDELPEIDEAQLSGVKFSRPSWGRTRTSVRARFTDRARGYVEDSRTVHNDAAIAALGRVEVAQIDVPGLTSGEMAERAAWEQLAPITYPFALLEASCDRTLWAQVPGGLFAFTSARLGISRMPMRVTSLEGGTLEDGRLQIQAAEDVFGLQATGFGDAPDPFEADEVKAFVVGWADPDELLGDSYPIAQALGINGERLWGDGAALFAGDFDPTLVLSEEPLTGARHQLVADGAGGFCFVCATEDNRVWAQRISASGARLWGDGLEIFDGEGVGPGFGSSLRNDSIKAVALGEYGLMVVWGDSRRDPTHDDLYVQRVALDGAIQLEPNGLIFWQSSGSGSVIYDAIGDGGATGGALVTMGTTASATPSLVHLDREGGRTGFSPLALSTASIGHDQVMMVTTHPEFQVPRESGAIVMIDWNAGAIVQATLGSSFRLWGDTGVAIIPGPTAQQMSAEFVLEDGKGGCWLAAYDPRGAAHWGGGVPVIMRIDGYLGNGPFRTDLGTTDWCVWDMVSDGAGGVYVTKTAMVPGTSDSSYAWLYHVQPNGWLDWSLEVDPAAVGVGEGFRFQYFVQLAADGAGGVIAIWLEWAENEYPVPDTNIVRAQRFSAAGERLWGDRGIEIVPGQNMYPHLVVAP